MGCSWPSKIARHEHGELCDLTGDLEAFERRLRATLSGIDRNSCKWPGFRLISESSGRFPTDLRTNPFHQLAYLTSSIRTGRCSRCERRQASATHSASSASARVHSDSCFPATTWAKAASSAR